jgi:hypothetical protein
MNHVIAITQTTNIRSTIKKNYHLIFYRNITIVNNKVLIGEVWGHKTIPMHASERSCICMFSD